VNTIVMHGFGKAIENRYYMTEEEVNEAVIAIAKALKSELPEEAHRADVLNFLLDETKEWVRARRINL